MSRPKMGFTLPEILCVLVIVASLIAFAFPAFSSAVKSSKRASCAGNLHQIAVAAETYLGDWDDLYPYSVNGIEKLHPELQSLGRPKGVDPSVFANTSDLLQPYVSTTASFRCPLDLGLTFAADPQALPSLFIFNARSSYYFADLLMGQTSSAWSDPSSEAYACDGSGEWHVGPHPSFFDLRVNSLHYDWHVTFSDFAHGNPVFQP